MRMCIRVVHQAHPHFHDLPFDELMFIDLNDVRDSIIVRALTLEDLVIMVVIDLTC